MHHPPCPVCGQSVSLNEQFAELPRVTSDSKSWPSGGEIAVCETCGHIHKPATEKFLQTAAQIFAAYQMYENVGGADQPIFDPSGGAVSRSRAVAQFLVDHAELPAGASVIDVGCGTGATLAALAELMPSLELYGSDLKDTPEEFLGTLSNFKQFFGGPFEKPLGLYDAVSFQHSLSCIEVPVSKSLALANEMLRPGGCLLIATPDLRTSLFDILITDVRAHFSAETLRYLVEASGFTVEILTDSLLPKEITLLARKISDASLTPSVDVPEMRSTLSSNVEWLSNVLTEAKTTRAGASNFGIFGTQIAGAWLYGALDKQIDFFVDENSFQIGKEIDGIPILAPDDVPAGASVYVPLVPAAAKNVSDRLRGKANYVPTPASALEA